MTSIINVSTVSAVSWTAVVEAPKLLGSCELTTFAELWSGLREGLLRGGNRKTLSSNAILGTLLAYIAKLLALRFVSSAEIFSGGECSRIPKCTQAREQCVLSEKNLVFELTHERYAVYLSHIFGDISSLSPARTISRIPCF